MKVKACSLNFRDFAIARGTYRMPVRENLVPLSDGAGEVIETGPGVDPRESRRSRRRQFLSALVRRRAAANTHNSALGGGIDGMLANTSCSRKTAS